VSIIIDIVIVGIILFCLLRGYMKGLIGVAFSIVSFIAALIISFILFVPVSSYVINNTEFDDGIKTAIVENFTGTSEKEAVTEESAEGVSNEKTTNFITSYIDEQIDESKGNTLEVVATGISEICVKGIVFLALFIVARIALTFFKVLANLIAKLPILKEFNKAGGIIFGLLKGFVITYGVLAVLLLVSPMFTEASFYKELNNSTVGSMMYNNNIIIKMIF